MKAPYRIDARQCILHTSTRVSSSCRQPAKQCTRLQASRRASLVSIVPLLFSLNADVPPPKIGGDCPDCLGPLNEHLNTCSGYPGSCVSSYDDSPKHFVNPWEYTGRTDTVLNRLESYLKKQDDVVNLRRGPRYYIYAQVKSPTGIDDIEFLVPDNDTTVELRAASRAPPVFAALDAAGVFRLWGRFEHYRKDLGFEILPVLRNRQSFLGGIVETPFDSYGPPPPQGEDPEQLLNWNESLN